MNQEFLRRGRPLDQRPVGGDVAPNDAKSAVGVDRVGQGTDDVARLRRTSGDARDGLAGRGHDVTVEYRTE